MKLLKELICTLTCYLLLGNLGSLYAQFDFYTVDGDHLSIHENCSILKEIPSEGTNSIAGTISIAITPNGKLYGIEESTLFEIDKINGSIMLIGNIVNKDKQAIFGNSLAASNNSTLFTLHKDTLYTINTSTGFATSIGKTNFFSGGDLAFFQGKLYLASIYNHLIEITLNSDKTAIEAVIDIGEMDVKSAFSLCTIYEDCDNKALHVITGNGLLYKINPSTAETEFICNYNRITYDAASFHDFVPSVSPLQGIRYPNVFSPNADGINDSYTITTVQFQSFNIYDRWGQLIYKTQGSVHWDGIDLNDNEVKEGLYYYTAEIDAEQKTLISAQDNTTSPCPSSKLILNQGVITLVR